MDGRILRWPRELCPCPHELFCDHTMLHWEGDFQCTQNCTVGERRGPEETQVTWLPVCVPSWPHGPRPLKPQFLHL